jgi:hypothetical protein
MNDSDDDNDHHQQLQEEDEDDDDDILVEKLIPILQQTKEVPLRTRNKINELVEEFLERLRDDVHEMLCDNTTEAENYSGLDRDRDTEKEVETIIRFFPEVLSTRKTKKWDNDEQEWYDWTDAAGGFGDYPIHCLSFVSGIITHRCNLTALAFIPLVVRLAIEFDVFEEEERGGLSCEDYDGNDVLTLLLISSKHTSHGD